MIAVAREWIFTSLKSADTNKAKCLMNSLSNSTMVIESLIYKEKQSDSLDILSA